MIKLQVIGHLGKDAVVKEVGGTKVINFSVAHTESFKNKQGEKEEKTTWVECAKWGEQTAVADYLKKGGQVFVEGTPEVRMYETAAGSKGASLVLRVMNLQLLGSGKAGANGAAPAQTATKTAPGAGDQSVANDDDLPF